MAISKKFSIFFLSLSIAGSAYGMAFEKNADLPLAKPLGSYQRRAFQRLLASNKPLDSLRVCVFKVSFSDREFQSGFDSLYFENELRHLSEYYYGASRGRFKLDCKLMRGVVQLWAPESYYGQRELWERRMAEILMEVVLERDSEVDFSLYDAVAVIHAGPGRETDFNGDSPYQVYSGFLDPEEMAAALADTLGTPGIPTNDGTVENPFYLDNLMVWPETASQDGFVFGALGIYAYEVGMRLGMLPLFDTTPEDYPNSQGCGNFDLMGYGIYNALGFVPAFPSAFNRYLMGWVDAVTVSSDCRIGLADISTAAEGDTCLVKIVLNPSEYFLVENRVHDSNFNGKFDFLDLNGNGIPENEDTLLGAEFDFFLTASTNLRPKPDSVVTGSGLMIWHVDETVIRAALESGAYPNDEPQLKGVDLEEADGIQDLDRPGGSFSFGSHYDSFRRGNNDRFSYDTEPSSSTNGGVRSGLTIDEISSAGHKMSFRVTFDPPLPFVRAELGAGFGAFAPISLQSLPGVLLLASDSGEVYVARVGSNSWNGSFECIIRKDSLRWITQPVVADIGLPQGPMVFLVSNGGVLHAYSLEGVPVAIGDDDSPEEIYLSGKIRAAISAIDVDADAYSELAVLSSDSDSTFLLVLGYDGPAPVGKWKMRGSFGFETALCEGQLSSLSAVGFDGDPASGGLGGLFFATLLEDRLDLRFAPLWNAGGMSFDASLIVTVSVELPANKPPIALPGENIDMAICSGDIDRDGSDEAALVVPGAGLCYFSARGRLQQVLLEGARPSSAIFVDVDADGTLETALRDEGHVYLFSGFGVSAYGWPLSTSVGPIEPYGNILSLPPVAGDIDGNGKMEIIFRVGGALHAFDFKGREVSGWPIPGEGPCGGSITLLEGSSGELYIVDCATTEAVGAGGNPIGVVSSVRRYDAGVAYARHRSWPCYRYDSRGAARQANEAPLEPREDAVDSATFIIYPNPVSGSIFSVRVMLSRRAVVEISIFDLEGELVSKRERRHDWPSGSAVPFEEIFSAENMAGGIYICRIEASGDGWRWEAARKFAIVR